MEDFGGITWFSGGSGRVISHYQQSVKGNKEGGGKSRILERSCGFQGRMEG